jgi:hypothetical protein
MFDNTYSLRDVAILCEGCKTSRARFPQLLCMTGTLQVQLNVGPVVNLFILSLLYIILYTKNTKVVYNVQPKIIEVI